MGHNTGPIKDQIKDYVSKYVSCDEKSAALNDERTEIRAKVEELGLDTKAFQDAVARCKKDRKKKEGYDESMKVIVDALGEMNMDDLFSWQDNREAKKAKEREDKAKKREEEKKKADEFKPAAERKPKPGKVISGKDAAAGETVGNA